MPAVRGSDEYASVSAGTKRDVSSEAGATAGFFNDRGWIIRLIEVHPTETDAVGNPGAPVHLVVAKTLRIPPDSIDPTVKNFHWGDLTRGLFEAHDAGADGCVLVDHAGFVTEGPGYNLFCVAGDEVSTPDRGALEGVTRRSVIELCSELGVPCQIRPISVSELFQADEIFVTSTAGGPMPVSRIDGHIMGNDRPGRLSLRLKEVFWKKREAGWHGTPVEYADGDAARSAALGI